MPEKYSCEITGSVEDGFTITNTHKPQSRSITVKKIWDDNNNQDGLRPDYLDIGLSGMSTVPNYELMVVMENVRLSAENNWEYTFENLPKNFGGEDIAYSVEEDVPAGYTTVDSTSETKVGGEKAYINVFTLDSVVFINTHEPETANIVISKTWDDEDDSEGIREEAADGAMLTLFANGVTVFKDLDIYDGGEEIVYTVAEDAVDGYTSEISGDSKKGFTLTNKHEPEKTDVTIEKYWNDDNDANKKRPDSVTVSILLKGRTIGTQEIKASDGWKTTFEDVYKYSNGEEIEYEVYEKPVSSYIPSVTGYKITNTFKDIKDSNSTPSSSKGASGSGGSSPKTGDKSPVALMIVILVLAALAIANMFVYRRRRG